MNYQELISYMIRNAEETYNNHEVTHFVGAMPLSFKDYPDFQCLVDDNYIDEIDEKQEVILYNFQEC